MPTLEASDMQFNTLKIVIDIIVVTNIIKLDMSLVVIKIHPLIFVISLRLFQPIWLNPKQL